jgi:hypothetical protein
VDLRGRGHEGKAVSERFVNFSADPQAVQQNRQLSRHRNARTLGDLAFPVSIRFNRGCYFTSSHRFKIERDTVP